MGNQILRTRRTGVPTVRRALILNYLYSLEMSTRR